MLTDGCLFWLLVLPLPSAPLALVGADSISLEKFLDVLFLKRGEPQTIMNNPSYWHFLLSWWPVRNDDNVLWLWYEDMKSNHREVVQRVATFLGLDASDTDLVDIATKHSTFDYMKGKLGPPPRNASSWTSRRAPLSFSPGLWLPAALLTLPTSFSSPLHWFQSTSVSTTSTSGRLRTT